MTIVDRKKELIISAAGKNMSPANIEAALKGSSPLIGQACVVGDGRAYNIALLVLDPDFAPTWSTTASSGPRRGRRGRQRDALAPRADQALDAAEDDWMPGGDELTPTMKLKRRPIMEKFAAEIECHVLG